VGVLAGQGRVHAERGITASATSETAYPPTCPSHCLPSYLLPVRPPACPPLLPPFSPLCYRSTAGEDQGDAHYLYENQSAYPFLRANNKAVSEQEGACSGGAGQAQ
jgi:hypothetical protein